MKPSIETLLAEIERTDDRATYVVLADALVEQADPRGELMQVQLALDGDPMGHEYAPLGRGMRALDRRAPDPDAPRAKLLERHETRALRIRELALREAREREILGDLVDQSVLLEFRYGLLDHIRFVQKINDTLISGVLERVCGSPEARMLRSIELRCTEDRRIEQVLTWLRSRELALPSSLRTVILGHGSQRLGYQYDDDEGEAATSFAGVLDVFPRLCELWVDLGTTRAEWQPLDSDHLQHLTYLAPAIHAEALGPLAASRLPALESFVLWTGGSYTVNYRGDEPRGGPAGLRATDLEPIFSLLDRCPNLRTVGFGNYARDVTELVAALAAHPFAAHVETLDLSCADAIDARALAPQLDRLPALRRLIVEDVELKTTTLATEGRQVVGGFRFSDARYRTVVCIE